MEPSLDCHTLIDILEKRAESAPDLRLFTFLKEGEEEQGSLTSAELAAQARNIGAWLAQRGLVGQRILLLFPQGLAFVAAYFGCAYAAAVGVPAPIPHASRLVRTLPRLKGILENAAPAAVLTNRAGVGMAAEVTAHLPDLTRNLQWLAFEDCPFDLASTWRRPELDPASPAHFQYTSGSTAEPKGTIITHANIVANSRAH
jgi:acyl-CoA synthetase (AMP-forming)/AMP-acid ligase II